MEGDFRIGRWLVQPSLNCISEGGTTRHLEPKVMEVLVELARRPGEVVAKEELMRAVWPDTFVGEDALLRCVSELRRVLEDDSKVPKYIATIHKRGYRLIAEVSAEAQPGAEEGGPAVPARASRRTLIAAGLAIIAGGLLLAFFIVRLLWQTAPTPRDRIMLAVLPFANLSGDPGQEYFSDGLTEEMIAQLARLEPVRLGVIARTSALQYKQTVKTIGQIGRELKVDFVVEGAVRREDGRLRITAQLIQVADQAHLWAGTYDRELSGVLAVQAEVARAVADKIRLTLASAKSSELASARPVNAEAYVAYLMGNHHRHKLTPEDLEIAIKHFQRAVELDPGFARAWLGLSDCYRMLGSWWGDWPPKRAFPLAKETMARVLKLDGTLAEAHGSLGWIHFVYDWDWVKAESEFTLGVELGPNARDALSPFANFLRRMKRLEEARLYIERAVEVDPLSVLEVTEEARVYLDMGEPARAEAVIARVSELAPDSRATLVVLGQSHVQTGALDKGIAFLEQASRATRRDRLSLPTLGVAYARAGRLADARAVLETLLSTPEVGQGAIAELYAALGEKEQAIRWWQKALEERDPRMVWLRLYSSDHPLWGDPRFQELIRQMKFPA